MAVVSTHVLDAANGTHAAGVEARLVHLGDGRELASGATDAGGRLSLEAPVDDANPAARYQLVLATGAYWSRPDARSAAQAPGTGSGPGTGRIEEIVLRFSMPDPGARYHMPVVISPNGHSTWLSLPE